MAVTAAAELKQAPSRAWWDVNYEEGQAIVDQEEAKTSAEAVEKIGTERKPRSSERVRQPSEVSADQHEREYSRPDPR